MAAAVLDQDEVWINATGGHRLDNMDPDHRANLIPFLRGNVRSLWAICFPDAEIPATTELEAWLEAKPLMQRLVALEQGRPIDDRRATAERNAAHETATGYQKIRVG